MAYAESSYTNECVFVLSVSEMYGQPSDPSSYHHHYHTYPLSAARTTYGVAPFLMQCICDSINKLHVVAILLPFRRFGFESAPKKMRNLAARLDALRAHSNGFFYRSFLLSRPLFAVQTPSHQLGSPGVQQTASRAELFGDIGKRIIMTLGLLWLSTHHTYIWSNIEEVMRAMHISAIRLFIRSF